jgi:hypothetical protein
VSRWNLGRRNQWYGPVPFKYFEVAPAFSKRRKVAVEALNDLRYTITNLIDKSDKLFQETLLRDFRPLIC